ncbi:LPXTG-anchored surface protein SpsA [Staphylococcus delphini]|uniref:LPXTG-anchored surface protein SpsA n=1 Tax=Staphylococcus delphini TaxID=53344 RepID=UPI0023B2E457|nr:LPXTG-anchored surface protein SpsA [Staphylococcus delphini]MDE9800350.1 LPXTG-anchored surface protein SpsA [Staphylococcus delphini]MDE9807623.1 LPXTG-anchored surface protein SpsA [Staphylococcus delphini]
MTERKSPSSQNMRHRLVKAGTVLLLVGSGLQMPSTLSHEMTAIAQTDTTDDLKTLRENADKKVKALQYLNTDYKNDFLSLIREYDTSSKNIEAIVDEAETANRLAHDAQSDDEIQPKLDAIDEKISALKAKVDEGQRESTEAREDVTSTEAKTAETEKRATSTEGENKVKQSSSAQTIVAPHHGQQDASALKDQIKNDVDALKQEHAARDNQLTPLQGIDSAITRIDHFVSENVENKSDNYFEEKRQHLQNFEQDIKKRTDISGTEKATLLEDAKTVANQLNAQNDTILTELQQSDDKRAAVEAILGEIFNAQEAAQRAKQIDVKGKTDQQLANQIHQQADGLIKTSSDDLLLGMLENNSNTQGLVESILRTRFDEQEAHKIAGEIMQGKPSNTTILDRLKDHFKANGKASGDDILNALINNTDADTEVIESILGGRLNAENAKLIADRVQQEKKKTHQNLKAIEDELSAQANRLLTLRKQLQQIRHNTKTDMNDLFAPLRRIANILGSGLNRDDMQSSGRTNDKLQQLLNRDHSLLDRDGGLFKHDFAPKPNIDPYQAINSQTASHGFLDGLFDQNGDFNLPNTGEIVKRTWLPLGVLVVAIGVLILTLRFHKKTRKQ